MGFELTNNGNGFFIDDTARQQMEIEFGAINNNCMTSIVTTLRNNPNKNI